MTYIDYITVAIFAGGVLLAGFSFSRTGKSMKNFFAAGGNVPWWIVGISLYMGFFSAGTFVVWGSIAYSLGWVAITIQLTIAVAGFVVAFVIAPKWKKTYSLTAAEFITRRLGVNVQKLYTYLFLLINMFTTGAYLYPVSKIVQVSSGLSLESSILLIGGVSILYVAVGGLWAVVVTDVLQFLILTAAIIIVVPLSFEKIGGISNLINNAPPGFFKLFNGEYTLMFIIAFCLFHLVFLGGTWSNVQRFSSVSSPKDAKKVGLLFGALYLVSPVIWMLPPMIYRIFNPHLTGFADEGAYLLMCKEALPKGMLGLVLGGMIFATASSLNAVLNISAGVFTNDIFKQLRPKTSDKSLMRIARLSTTGFGLVTIIVAMLIPYMGGIVNVVISVGALTGAPLCLPIIWCLFSKRQNAMSVIFSTLLSLGINCFFKFITPLFGFSLDMAQEMMFGVLVPIIILLFFEIYYGCCNYTDINFATNKDYERKKEKEDSINNEKEIKTDNSYSIRIIGKGIAVSGLLIIILGIISADTGNFVVETVGSVLLVIGILIFLSQKKRLTGS